MMYQKTVKEYFRAKAQDYDLVDEQQYWVLSDKLLWFFLKKTLKNLPEKFIFLDAGGGTGRWSLKILKEFKQSRGVIFDLSPEMLAVAKRKFINKNVDSRIEILNDDLNKLKKIKNHENFHLIFNFHNVIGFLDSPEKVIKNLSRIVKKNGLLISLVPNIYHAIYFNLSLGNTLMASNILKTEKGKFTEEMPSIHFFSPKKIKAIYKKAKLEIVDITGFPSTIYPGYQETQLKGATEKIQDLLSDKKEFKKIYDIEKNLVMRNDIASRGNNILIIGRKNNRD